MTYTLIPLEDFLSNAHSPSESELESFSKHRDKLLLTNENESEEHQKIALIEFLAKSFAYECNTKNRIDLSIYEDNKAKVLFEVKSLSNTNEFIKGGTLNTLHNLESKAFYESILYFLREYKTHNNNDIKHIILTNTRDFYLIDAREYLTFAKDKTILKAFDNCDKNQGTDTSTSKFYATLKDYLPSLNSTLKFTHFNIQTTPLPLLYQALSPQVLLKRKSYIDANTLNQSFYDELLYILGLKEIDQKGKILILPTTEQNTLLDSICNKLGLDRDKDFETIFSLLTTWNNRILFLRLLESMLLSFKHIKKPFLDIDTLQNFTDLNTLFFDILALKKEKRKTDLKLKDSIPYLNSSLFDKTELEKQNKEISKLDSNHLAIFKHSILKKDKEYKDTQSLPLLEYLFKFLHAYDFTTTPKDIINHTKTNHDKLINAAVLGLVFEKLNGYKEGSFYTPSFITSYMCKESLEKVVIDKFNERKSWECNSLESLAQKLDKLTDSKDGYKEANAIFDSIKVCDPAVGSGHFLVSMLNAMIELKFRLKILCEIHIDDNGERDYKRLKDIRLRLENDEILIQDSNNTLHTYQTPAHENLESHIIQKALFHNKRILIESCLFGVDINPNSCEITKLRLWIELLKYSFYIFDSNGKNTGDLETLPNIDINIKCGNSLVSNIALDMTKESLEKDLKNRLNDNATLESANEILSTINDIQNKLPHTIQDYKDAVSAYKNETNAELKSLHKQKIHTTQSFIIAIFHKTSKAYQNFKNTLSSYLQRYGYNGIDNATLQNKSLDSALIKSLNDYTINFNFHKSLDIPKEPQGFVEKELITLIESMREYENLINDTNAFEWRFAFPEVLDSNGDFLGFDLVIGNPPYMQVPKGLYDKTRFPYSEGKDKGKQNLYKVFVELGYNLGHTNSLVAFITQSSIMCDLSAQFTRELLLKETQMQYFVEFKDNEKIFTNVSQGVCIVEFLKAKPKPNSHFKIAIDNTESKMDKIDFESISQKQILEFFPLYEIPLIKKGEMPIIAKVKTDKILLKDMIDSSLQGNINTIHLKRIKSEKQTGIYLIKGENIHRYFIDNNLMHCIESSETLKMCNHNTKSHIIATQGIHTATSKNRIHCTLLESKNTNKFVFLDSTKMLFVECKETAKYLIGLLNSKLLNWLFRKTSTNNNVNLYELENLPIPQITESNKPLCDEIIKCVDKILEIKACHTEALAEVSKNTESKKD
ncbi:class I SAM-dependent DNA methyltransferase, partial [Helicobacter bilis]